MKNIDVCLRELNLHASGKHEEEVCEFYLNNYFLSKKQACFFFRELKCIIEEKGCSYKLVAGFVDCPGLPFPLTYIDIVIPCKLVHWVQYRIL